MKCISPSSTADITATATISLTANTGPPWLRLKHLLFAKLIEQAAQRSGTLRH